MRQLQNVQHRVMGIPEGEEREKGIEEIFEVIMAENCLKSMTATKPQIQEAQRTPTRTNVKKSPPSILY